MRKPTGQTLFLAAVVVVSSVVAGYLLFTQPGHSGRQAGEKSRLTLEDIDFNGRRAYGYLEQLCALGPRPTGSEAMSRQQQLLIEHFQKLGGQITRQAFQFRHPVTGQPVIGTNLLVTWHPQSRERVLLVAHYDTRPFPDRDPQNPRGTFVGANDGASGTALLMELAHDFSQFQSRKWPGQLGVDFLLVDAEEFVFDDRQPYFLGSEFFAGQYAKNPPPYRYRWGIVLDMVADADLQIYQERNSLLWRDTRPLVEALWQTAADLGVREFVPRPKHEIRDDHLPLRNVARIPTCDVIDFDYPPWHTQDDVPARCSALSLAKVGWVVRTWLQQAR
ncbi:MAG: M28 family peptidase [Pirellulales bacterium]|nr:M28 family peptidase [Pirellulales bacterium]